MIFLALILAFAVKLPLLIEVDDNWYYTRFISFGIINALIFYFMYVAKLSTNMKRFIVAGSGLCFLLLLFLPDNDRSASILMATIHIPLVLCSLLAAAYMANGWKQYELRLRYIRYLGEMLILTKIILLGGMVLAFITFALFSVIGLSIGEWYVDNVVVVGLVAAPVVATYLYDEVLNRESKLATVISNVFAPLFLITVMLYLSAMLYQQQSPYADRDFLISFNLN